MRFFVGLFRHSIWIHDGEFPIDFSPVPQRHRPFFCSLQGGQIQCFKQSCIAGEYGSLAIEFLVCAVQAFDGIGGIDELPYLLRICKTIWSKMYVIIAVFSIYSFFATTTTY